jgi:hypothetical protein
MFYEHLNFLHYENWEFNPANGWYGPSKVTFDGPNKLMRVNYGEINLNVETDLYSEWKNWLLWEDNSKYLKAFTPVGGDAKTDTESLDTTYFLENGWRILPWEGDYILNITGNIYTREPGQSPSNAVSGVSTSYERSSIVTVKVAGGATTESRLLEIWRILGLDSDNPQTITDAGITVADLTLAINQLDLNTTQLKRS